jgi:hypothetical protein
MFDFDDSNGNYDVVTQADFIKWEDEARLEASRKRQENTPAEEPAEPYFDVPY